MSTWKKGKRNQTSLQEDTPSTSHPYSLDIESTPLKTEQPVGTLISATAATTSLSRNERSSILVGALTPPSTNRKRIWEEAMCEANIQYGSSEKFTGESAVPGSSSYSTFCPSQSRPRPYAKSRSDGGNDGNEATMAGILTTTATLLGHTVDQLKLDTPAQTLNFDPVDFRPLVIGRDAPEENDSRTLSTFSHLHYTLRSIDDDDDSGDDVSVSEKPTHSGTIRDTPSVVTAENKPEMASIVGPNEPSETPGTSTTTQDPSSTQSKKEINMAKTVEFLQGRSFSGDTELSRMVGDLQEQMTAKGLCVFDRFLGDEKGRMVLNDVLRIYQKGDFVKGQLEPSPNPSSSSSSSSPRVVRGDVIRWLEGNESGCNNIKYLMERIDAVVMMCGEPFGGYTIKQRTRAMVACYPGDGTHYLRHIDNPCRNGRVLTCIYYLNVDWDIRKDGGLLRIYPEGSHEVANIQPLFDRLIFFWSDSRNPHEVKPAYRSRFAITLWYYDEKEQIEWLRRRASEVPSLQNPG